MNYTLNQKVIKDANKTVAELTRVTGLSYNTIYKPIKGLSKTSEKTARQLAKALDVDFEALVAE